MKEGIIINKKEHDLGDGVMKESIVINNKEYKSNNGVYATGVVASSKDLICVERSMAMLDMLLLALDVVKKEKNNALDILAGLGLTLANKGKAMYDKTIQNSDLDDALKEMIKNDEIDVCINTEDSTFGFKLSENKKEDK